MHMSSVRGRRGKGRPRGRWKDIMEYEVVRGVSFFRWYGQIGCMADDRQ